MVVRIAEAVYEAARTRLEEIARLRETRVSARDLDTAKRQLEVAMVYELVTNAAIADRIGYDVTTLGAIRPLEERLAAIEAVDAADVQRVARTYLGEPARNVVRVVPRPAGALAEPSARAGGGR